MSGFGFSASSTHGAAAPKGHLETHGSSYLRPTLWPYRVHMVRPGRRPHVETTALAQCDIHVKESKVWNQAAYNPLLLRSAAAAAPVRPPPGGRGKPQPASPPRPKMAAWLPRRSPGSNMAPGRSAGLWTTSPRSERAGAARPPPVPGKRRAGSAVAAAGAGAALGWSPLGEPGLRGADSGASPGGARARARREVNGGAGVAAEAEAACAGA